VDALSFNDNCVLVRVSPGAAGRSPLVEVLPAVNALTVENTAVTRTSRRGPRLLVQRVGTRLLVRGSVPRGAMPYETWVTVPDPALYFGAGLKAALAEEGIEVTGSLRPVRTLPGNVWERVAVHRSDLLTAVQTTNKRSQNFYAEALAKLLGARLCGLGSWERGVLAISEFIEKIGIPRGTFSLADGSGMSRKNRFTPRQITLLLRAMYLHPRGSEFIRSLPYSGEDNGGWRQRLAAAPYAGNVMAKTGTLSEVSALSGYAKAVSGKYYAFSILINKANGKARAAQDRLVMTIIDNG
jgi:D-alanyl-D-alanine carboxypeptidase/D-alanyl-D-alanine-endopeptidase (penicillin-binding protein 4)